VARRRAFPDRYDVSAKGGELPDPLRREPQFSHGTGEADRPENFYDLPAVIRISLWGLGIRNSHQRTVGLSRSGISLRRGRAGVVPSRRRFYTSLASVVAFGGDMGSTEVMKQELHAERFADSLIR